MAVRGTPVGTIFVEVDLDWEPYTKAQKRLLKDATSTTMNIEKNYKDLGIRSAKEFDLMRAKIQNAYNRIIQDSKLSAQEIVRIEKAKADQLTRINEQQFGKQASMLQKLKANWLAATAVITASIFAIRKAWNMADEAAQFEEQRAALHSLGSQYDVTSGKIIKDMQEAARGLLSMKDAADIGAKAMLQGLNPEQIKRFTAAAEVLSDVTGETLPAAFEKMTIAAATGRMQTLAQMGIVLSLTDVYKKYAEGLGRTVDSLTETEKAHVRIDAVLQAAEQNVAKMGGSVDTNKDKMDRLKVTVDDLRLTMGSVFIRIAAGMVGAFHAISSASMSTSSALWKLIELYHKADAMLSWGGKKQEALEAARQAAENAASDWQASLDLAMKSQDNFSAMIASSDELAASTSKTVQGMKELGNETSNVNKELDRLDKAAKERHLAQSLKDIEDLIKRRKEFSESQTVEFSKRMEEADKIHWTHEREKEDLKELKELMERRKAFLEKPIRDFSERMEEEDKLHWSWEPLVEDTNEAFSEMQNAVSGWAKDFSRTLTDLVWGADLSFKNIAESFGRMLTQMLIEKKIIEPLLEFSFGKKKFDWFGSALQVGGAFSGGAGAGGGAMGLSTALALVRHSGGIVGDQGPARLVDARMFENAPKFHGGNEYPAILKRGEGVFTQEQMKAMSPAKEEKGFSGNITINAVDAASFNELTRRNPMAIVGPFLEALRKGGMLRDSIRGVM